MKHPCLAENDLRQVIAGELPPDDFDSAMEHLDQCESCRSAAQSLQDASRLASLDVDELQNETACQAAVQRLLQLPAESLPPIHSAPERKLGPYLLTGSLGSGGMGTVLLGQHERLKRDCAIKLLPRERVHTPGWLDRFEREMAAVAALEHPNIVRATDAGHEDGWHYLVMEYLDGLDLGRVARRSSQLGIADACEIVRQAALGLSAIHASGLVHRDIKPSNLMLTRTGVVKVLDLGLVLSGDDPICVDDRLTTVGHLMGTVAFMSPEQLADSSQVGPAADLYSLGATLYRLIGGRTPHQRPGGLAKQILAISNDDAPSLGSIRPDVPNDVSDLVEQLLHRDPLRRPDSADEVASRLTDASEGSRLKKLVSTAIRIPDSEEASRDSLLPEPKLSARTPPRTKLIAMAMAVAAILIAALVFKIKTDVGDLIVHSESGDVTIVVSRGEKVVDRLHIEQGKENKLTLSKGTYRIAIQGGGPALKLSEEVVTIGRGTTVPVQVESVLRSNDTTPQSGEQFQGKDYAYWLNALQHERDLPVVMQAIAAVQSLAATPAKELEAASASLRLARRWGAISRNGIKSPADFAPSDRPSGNYMAYLSEFMRRYSLEASYGAINQELVDGNQRSLLAILLLLSDDPYASYRSRDAVVNWIAEDNPTGSRRLLLKSVARNLHRRAAPLGSNQDPNGNFTVETLRYHVIRLRQLLEEPIVDDEDLTQFLGERFASQDLIADELSLRAGLELAQSGRDAPSWSQLADSVLSIKYQWNVDRGPAVFESIAQHAPDELLAAIDRQLISLAKSPVVDVPNYQAFNGMGGGFGGAIVKNVAFASVDLKRTSWKSAFEFYAISADPTQAAFDRLARIRADIGQPPTADSVGNSTLAIVQNTIESLSQRFTDKHGTPPQQSLETTPVPGLAQIPSPPNQEKTSSQPLYSGKPIAHYMNVLSNDLDVNTVTDAITAVELLSRNTYGRQQAAKETLAIARRWGSTFQMDTFDAANAQGQSEIFMRILRPTFHRYFQDEGISAIEYELKHGNKRSKYTAVNLLDRFRVGHDNPSYTLELQTTALEKLQTWAQSATHSVTLAAIEERLVDGIEHLPDPQDKLEIETRYKTALWLHLALNTTIDKDSWAHEYVTQKINEYQQLWADQGQWPGVLPRTSHVGSRAFDGSTKNVWGLNEDLCLAAARIPNFFDAHAEFLYAALMDEYYTRVSPRTNETLAFFREVDHRNLLAAFEPKLTRLAVPSISDWNSPVLHVRDQAALLADANSPWHKTLPIYAKWAAPKRYHIGVLRACRKRIPAIRFPSQFTPDYIALDSAIEVLSKRYEEIHGEPVPEDETPTANPGDLPDDRPDVKINP